MSLRIFKKAVLSIVILAAASLPVRQIWADGMGPVGGAEGLNGTDNAPSAPANLTPGESSPQENMEVNLPESLKDIDEATLQKSAITQADAIKQIPGELRAQGVQVSPEQEAQINQVSDKLNADANKPGLKKRMMSDLKKSKKEGEKGGIVVLKGIGWGGEAALGISLAPLSFGTDLVSSMITGKGVFTSGQNGLPALVGEIGGITTLYYTVIALDAIGVTFEGPFLASGMIAVVINQFVCPDNLNSKNTDLKNYCEVNAKIMKTLWGGSAKGGEKLGAEAHKGIMISGRWMIKPLRHLKKQASPTPAPSASSSPEPSQEIGKK